MKTLLILITAFFSSTALAHPGHLSAESAHGFLHIEHIVALAALGVVALIFNAFRNK